MADRGRPKGGELPIAKRDAIARLARDGHGIRESARLLDIDRNTVRKYLRLGVANSPTYGK